MKVFEVSVMFCSQITSYVANNSSCRILFGYYNVLRIKWMCLKTLRTVLVCHVKREVTDFEINLVKTKTACPFQVKFYM